MAKSMAGQFDKLVTLLGIEPLLTACLAGYPAGKAARGDWPRPVDRAGAAAAG
jgi:ABC-type molybdate transport system ATPase subunit